MTAYLAQVLDVGADHRRLGVFTVDRPDEPAALADSAGDHVGRFTAPLVVGDEVPELGSRR